VTDVLRSKECEEILFYILLLALLIPCVIHKPNKSYSSKRNTKLYHMFIFIDYVSCIPKIFANEPMSFGVFVAFIDRYVIETHYYFLGSRLVKVKTIARICVKVNC
jgi:hypothetical protein